MLKKFGQLGRQQDSSTSLQLLQNFQASDNQGEHL